MSISRSGIFNGIGIGIINGIFFSIKLSNIPLIIIFMMEIILSKFKFIINSLINFIFFNILGDKRTRVPYYTSRHCMKVKTTVQYTSNKCMVNISYLRGQHLFDKFWFSGLWGKLILKHPPSTVNLNVILRHVDKRSIVFKYLFNNLMVIG